MNSFLIYLLGAGFRNSPCVATLRLLFILTHSGWTAAFFLSYFDGKMEMNLLLIEHGYDGNDPNWCWTLMAWKFGIETYPEFATMTKTEFEMNRQKIPNFYGKLILRRLFSGWTFQMRKPNVCTSEVKIVHHWSILDAWLLSNDCPTEAT